MPLLIAAVSATLISACVDQLDPYRAAYSSTYVYYIFLYMYDDMSTLFMYVKAVGGGNPKSSHLRWTFGHSVEIIYVQNKQIQGLYGLNDIRLDNFHTIFPSVFDYLGQNNV